MNKHDLSKNAELSAFLERVVSLVDFQGIKPTAVNERSVLGDTLLHFAARWDEERAGKILLEEGADPNARGEYGNTPLHEAVGQKSFGVLKLLLTHGSSKELRNDDGLTAVALAKLSDDPRLEEVFS